MRWYVTLGLFEEEGLRGKAEEQKQLRPAQEAVEGLGTKFYLYSHPYPHRVGDREVLLNE